MQLKIVLSLLLIAVGASCAYPYADPSDWEVLAFEPQQQEQYLVEQLTDEQEAELEPLSRVRRQLNVQGGGSPRQGFDLSVNGRAPVWQSPNGRHQFDVTGQYAQHLGGPYGNSRPQWGAGGMYTFRF